MSKEDKKGHAFKTVFDFFIFVPEVKLSPKKKDFGHGPLVNALLGGCLSTPALNYKTQDPD